MVVDNRPVVTFRPSDIRRRMMFQQIYEITHRISICRDLTCFLGRVHVEYSARFGGSRYGCWRVGQALEELGMARVVDVKDGVSGDRFPVSSESREKRVPKPVGGSTHGTAPVANSFDCCGHRSVSSSQGFETCIF